MNRAHILAVALLVNSAPQLLLGTALSIGATTISEMPARAQSAEAVAKIAQAITVRIEGATQGSGVLVKRDGNRYTVLTAWHVVSGQRAGEELDIYTPDGKRHPVEQGSIKRLGDVDLVVLSFTSSTSYEAARVGDAKSVSSGSNIYVSGFPLPTSAVPSRLFRFLKGDVIANATVAIPNGYQLLYSNQTLPGMSGGPVLNAQGRLVGIHGQGETDSMMGEQQGVAIKTGTNQAVPIAYYSQYLAGAAVVAASAQASSADDYLAQAKALLGKEGSEQLLIALATKSLALRKSSSAYFYRAYAKEDIGDTEGAFGDYGSSILLNPSAAGSYVNRGEIRRLKGDIKGALNDYNQAIAANSQDALAYGNRGIVKRVLGDIKGALADYDIAISLYPDYAKAYHNRGNLKLVLHDKRGACGDYKKAAALGLLPTAQWLQSDNAAWCRNMP
jgi:S1-C subfamily serine protease